MSQVKDPSTSKPYEESLKAFLFFMKLFGLFVDGIRGNFRYFALGYSFLLLAANFGTTIHSVLVFVSDCKSNGVRLIAVLETVGYFSSVSLLHVLFILHCGKIRNIHSKLNDLGINRNTKRMAYLALGLLILSVQGSLALCVLYGVSSAIDCLPNEEKLAYPSFAIGLFSISSLTLVAHFDRLNNEIHQLIDYRLKSPLESLDTRTAVDGLRRNYLQLISLKNEIIDCFGPFLLIINGDLFIRLISVPYYILQGTLNSMELILQISLPVSICDNFSRFCIVCYVADKLQRKSTEILEPLWRLQLCLMEDEDQSSYQKVTGFVLEVVETKTRDTTAAGFFTINRGNILSLISAMVTYVLVLVQLPKD